MRREERREAMLEIAQQSFLAHGYSATSMSAIAAEIGGSKSTLWTYFPSKEALFTAVLEAATSSFRQDLADLLKPTGEMEQTLFAFCQSYLTKITSPEGLALHRLVASESVRFPEIAQIFYESAPAAITRLLTAYLAKQIDRGNVINCDPLDAARILMSMCLGDLHLRKLWGQTTASPREIEKLSRSATSIFMRSFATDLRKEPVDDQTKEPST